MSRLTPRERTYVMALGLTVFFMGMLVLVYLRDKSLSETEDDIAATRRALSQVYTSGSVYKEKLAEKEEREKKISADTLLFSTLLAEAGSAVENVQPSNEEELPPLEQADGLVKRSFKFNLRSVTLEDLVKFLTKIESKEGHVIIVESLLIRSPSNAEDRLNCDVTIATWERRGAESEGDQEDDDKKEGAS
ncbi:MAG: hypothetical protein KDK70_20240 [Myxococcales bacterium]|nr:hypothetical protein [Myxococcales bacterium]